jgi:hypothetical protein
VENVQGDFAKAVRHPVLDTDALRTAGRSVECMDCHNAHKARSGTRDYNATATSTRNNVSNSPALQGASGVAVNYTGMGNFQAPASQ